jgi:DNA-directed RNA polymerase specialized sigma24 family protein
MDGTDGLARLSDAILVNAVAQGELEALAEAYERHGASVYRGTANWCSPMEAVEVTREVFLAMWLAPDDFSSTMLSLRSLLLADAYRRAVTPRRSAAGPGTPPGSMAPAGSERLVPAPWAHSTHRSPMPNLLDTQHGADALGYLAGYRN